MHTSIGEGLYIDIIDAKQNEKILIEHQVNKGMVQFYVGFNSDTILAFSGGRYTQTLEKNGCLFFYNPTLDLPLTISSNQEARILALGITVQKLHSLFVRGAEEIAFINEDNINKKYYLSRALTPGMLLVANQFFGKDFNGLANVLFQKAKFYEFLALFFNKDEDKDVEQCPFLKDEDNVVRIRQAKKVIMERASDPPTLAELSKEIGLNEYRLKEGFKNIYGKTVFQFLNDYRMDTARHWLEDGSLKVNEAAYQIGYTNPSHFIAAFKKKFGVTPKKYLQSKG